MDGHFLKLSPHFRSDRSQITHPSDPSNPNKFRKHGGGVLIAVRSDMEATVKRLSMRKGAEIISVELQVGHEKFVFCTETVCTVAQWVS